jgi:hypothetical protein
LVTEELFDMPFEFEIEVVAVGVKSSHQSQAHKVGVLKIEIAGGGFAEIRYCNPTGVKGRSPVALRIRVNGGGQDEQDNRNNANCYQSNIDAFVKSQNRSIFVIPAKAGIQ